MRWEIISIYVPLILTTCGYWLCFAFPFQPMSWFEKRKERNFIPPVEPENSSSRSAGGPYSSRPVDTYGASRDRYQRNQPVDAYSRGQGNLDNDRRELLSGYNPEKVSSGRFAHDGPALSEPKPGEENDEDVEGIKTQTRFIKQESVNSTRNALRMAREAEETARGTINKLGSQSGAWGIAAVDSCPILIMKFGCREAC
jgi:protein transport protein SEC9